MDSFLQVSAFIFPLFFSIILHEVAHGFVAYKFGDPTAKKAGRLTLNPIAHVDPVGTILVPGLLLMSGTPFLFGWAKPVPVYFQNLNEPKKDMGLVSLAGPMTNLILAILCAFVAEALKSYTDSNIIMQWIFMNFYFGIVVNLSLCAFNLFPILPLDGGRIIISLLPKKWALEYAKTERYGFFVLIGLLVGLPYLSRLLNINLDVVGMYMKWMMNGLMRIVQIFI